MEELLPKLISLLPTKGINLKQKIDNIKMRLGVSYVDVLWKSLVCLNENCTFPIDAVDGKLFCETCQKRTHMVYQYTEDDSVFMVCPICEKLQTFIN